MMKLVTPPAALPVTLAEAKDHLRVDDAAEDAAIGGLIDAAVSHLDGRDGVLGRAIMPQTWEMALDRFPVKEIRIPFGPVTSVTSIAYVAPDGVERMVSPVDYTLDAMPDFEGWIVPNADFAWPATMATVNAVRVRWAAGGGCPPAVKQAILLLVELWYTRREAAGEASAELPLGVAALLAPWRRVGEL